MIKWITIILAFGTFGYTQNLVQNSSFEEYTECPYDYSITSWDGHIGGSIEVLPPTSWINPTYGTPDYFNPCGGENSNVWVPDNVLGYQIPQHGDSYVGLYNIEIINNIEIAYREYIQQRLLAPITKGRTYRVCFWIVLADIDVEYASNGLGILFTKEQINFASSDLISGYDPQIVCDELVTNRNEWHEYCQEFTAEDNCEWLTMGNFNQIGTSIFTKVPGNISMFHSLGSYYYIDNISVVEIDKPESSSKALPNTFTPNADGVNDTWPGIVLQGVFGIQIYDRWGIQIFSGTGSWDGNVNGAEAPEGVYFYVLTQQDSERRSGTVTLLR